MGGSRDDYERLNDDGRRDPDPMDNLARSLNALGLLHQQVAVNAAAARDSDPGLHRARFQLVVCLDGGLFDRDTIAGDPDFAGLRADPGYRKLFGIPTP